MAEPKGILKSLLRRPKKKSNDARRLGVGLLSIVLSTVLPGVDESIDVFLKDV
jgi:hypothetical protein